VTCLSTPAAEREVFLGKDDDFGAPSLTDDAATGVPEVAPHEAAQRGDAGSQL
jgi:hypothetical protein